MRHTNEVGKISSQNGQMVEAQQMVELGMVSRWIMHKGQVVEEQRAGRHKKARWQVQHIDNVRDAGRQGLGITVWSNNQE